MKLAMIGMWHAHADGMVRQIAAHPDEFQLVAVYDADPAVAAARQAPWQQLLGHWPRVERLEDVWAARPEGVILEGRVHHNVALARQALEAGLPVMLEKPAGVDVAGLAELHNLARRKHLHVQMIYLFRYMPAVRKMLELAADGGLGEIYQFRARLPKTADTYPEFVEQLAPYAGGIYFEMAGHVIDLMVRLLGAPQGAKSIMGHHHHLPPPDYVDHGVALFEFERAAGIIEVPAMEVAPHQRRIEVFGSRGACVIPHLGSGHLANADVQVLESYRTGDDDWRRWELPDEPLQIRDLREFAAVVSGRKEADFSLDHDLDVQRWLLASCGMQPAK